MLTIYTPVKVHSRNCKPTAAINHLWYFLAAALNCSDCRHLIRLVKVGRFVAKPVVQIVIKAAIKPAIKHTDLGLFHQ
jgi:hypothetical protein